MLFLNRGFFHLRSLASRVKESQAPASVPVTDASVAGEQPSAVDSGKRTFLRLAGLVGLGVVATQLFPNKAEAYVLGGAPTSPVVGLKDHLNNRIDPAQETGGNLALIKTNTAPFLVQGEGAYIQQDSSGSIAKETGNLLQVATNTTNIASLTFKSGALVTTMGSGGTASVVGLQDTTSTQINPATDDSLTYLRRMVKLMESQAAVDSGNRQRITLDSLGPSTAITTTVPVSGTVAVSGTVTTSLASTTVTSISAGTNVIGGVTIDGQGRQMFTEIARQAYNSGIRSNLGFS